MNIFIKITVCLLASLGAGVGTGFAGMSAAAVIAPVLTEFLGLPSYEAIGIGLISDVLASAVSAFTYHKNGNLDIKNSLILLITVLFSTVLGSFIASLMHENAMGNTSLIAMAIIGLRFIIKPITTTKEQMNLTNKKSKIIKSIIGGLLVGFICGFVGAGGGMMMLFVLTTFLGYELHIAIGTSVFIMCFTALTGGVSHFLLGGVSDVFSLILCVIFTLIFARISSKIANKSNITILNRIVGVVLVLTSVIILII